MSKKLVALDASNKSVLNEIDIGTVWCGRSVSGGRVYVGIGSVIFEPWNEVPPEDYRFNFPIEPSGAVISFGMPGEDAVDRPPETEGSVL